jgi:hypothetical protein
VPDRIPLGAVFRLALYYGIAGFGGGYSVLAQLRPDLVARRKWLTDEDFFVLAELSKSLPGTPATNLLALLGQRVAGVKGGFIAAGGFLLPSTILMIGCGAAYSLFRNTPSRGFGQARSFGVPSGRWLRQSSRCSARPLSALAGQRCPSRATLLSPFWPSERSSCALSGRCGFSWAVVLFVSLCTRCTVGDGRGGLS